MFVVSTVVVGMIAILVGRWRSRVRSSSASRASRALSSRAVVAGEIECGVSAIVVGNGSSWGASSSWAM
jgi:membrane protein implicated in regulation of membrane protease activity